MNTTLRHGCTRERESESLGGWGGGNVPCSPAEKKYERL